MTMARASWDTRIGVAMVMEIIRDNGRPLWSFMVVRGLNANANDEKKQILADEHSNMKKG
jgi:hypothetical protein